jgi:hypothetical protein
MAHELECFAGHGFVSHAILGCVRREMCVSWHLYCVWVCLDPGHMPGRIALAQPTFTGFNGTEYRWPFGTNTMGQPRHGTKKHGPGTTRSD